MILYFQQCSSNKLSKSKKKKMKKKLKKQIEKQKLQQEEIEQGRLVEKVDENEDNSNNQEYKDCMQSDEKKLDEHFTDKCEQNCNCNNTELKTEKSEKMETSFDENDFCDEVGSRMLQEQCVVSDDETRKQGSKEMVQQPTQSQGE